MASLTPTNFTMTPRKSTETDRRHLLAESVAPSESASMIFDDGDATPRARSPVRASTSRSAAQAAAQAAAETSSIRRGTIATPTPYRGFPSEEGYLAALRAWAESKKYLECEYMLNGFYGDKTMEDYANSGPGIEMGIGLRKKWKARKAKKAERRNTVA